MASTARDPAPALSPDAEDGTSAALDALIDALGHLEETIAREAVALAAADSAPLLEAVEDKRRALAAVETLIRQPSLGALLGAGPARAHDALAQSPAWPRLLETLEACRAANEAVGGAIASARRSTETSLKWLGLAADDDTYAETGEGPRPRPRDLAVC